MLPTIDPTELIPAQFDFTDLLQDYPGATITAARITIEVVGGTDATPAARLSGALTISGLVVRQFFQPNAAQITESKYRVSCNIDVAGQNYKPTIAVQLRVEKRTDA